MGITIYGSPRSRTMRVLWMAQELGLEYTLVSWDHQDSVLKSPAFLALNPAGTIPTIVDDLGLVDGNATTNATSSLALSESLAINVYLARRYGADGLTPLYPTDEHAEANVLRLTLWAQVSLEPWVQRDRHLDRLRAVAAAELTVLASRGLAILERMLDGREWLVASHFTVADLNVAAVLSPSRASHLDLRPYPRVANWLARCYQRPAAVAVRARYAADPVPAVP